MKTPTATLQPARPAVVRESAPSLVSDGLKTRAKATLPAPHLTAGANDIPAHEQAVIDAAIAILRNRLRKPGGYASDSSAARALVMLQLARRDRECFLVLLLDAQLRLIATEEVAHGTLTQTTVHPREIVRAAMRHNAAAVIFAHNHPSGKAIPSGADIELTAVLKRTLALVDVHTIDHFIVAGDSVASFVEIGLM